MGSWERLKTNEAKLSYLLNSDAEEVPYPQNTMLLNYQARYLLSVARLCGEVYDRGAVLLVFFLLSLVTTHMGEISRACR